jgi:CubicO group peptidase (beta-lactamase class C family)
MRNHLLSLCIALSVVACSDAAPGPAAAPDGGVQADAAVVPESDAGDAATLSCEDRLRPLEAAIGAKLDAAARDTKITDTSDYTVILERADGRRFTHSQGASTADTVYESASTSKWVTAAILLDLVDQGKLTLTSKPHEFISFFPESNVTLRDLLSFTSGYFEEAPCQNRPDTTIEACVRDIVAANPSPPAPRVRYQYSSSHMHIAGLMAMNALKVSTFAEVFDAFKARTGLFPTAVYDLPSASNPRLAGGMHWRAKEYFDFVRALAKGTLLSASARAEMLKDQRSPSRALRTTPAFNGLEEDWSYGLGNWVECPSAKTLNSFDCKGPYRFSSAGAYGAYPFIDQAASYSGIFARQGKLGSGFEGVLVMRAANAEIDAWLKASCP